MAKCPYTFPARSRVAMTAYILNRTSRGEYPICWTVKAHRADWSGHTGEEKVNARFDYAWQRRMDDDAYFSSGIFEDAGRTYSEGEYTTYPGSDQGDWSFEFFGRSGGWLALVGWQGCKLHGRDFDFREYVEGCDFAAVRKLYRALVCMDQDITPANASEEVSYHVNDARAQWEAEQEAEEVDEARDLEATRPDMYGAAS